LDNSLNNTQSAPDTGNPQNAGEANGASDSSDFQKTAPVDALNQSRALEVQETGDPVENGSQAAANGSMSNVWWGLGILVIIAIGSMLAIKFLKEQDEENKTAVAVPAKSTSKPAEKKSAVKSTVKKTRSGKPAAKKTKKATKKKRR
jgi:flagellar biosynthesis/type III secretory pathway M-ring protein FliF/YscJ